MSIEDNPYEPPRQASTVRETYPWRASLLTYLAALCAILGLYLVGERHYFGDGTNDLRLLARAFPQLAALALAPMLVGRVFRPRTRTGQSMLGVLLGPAIAFAAYLIYPLVSRSLH
jgi:hypothetical protein